MDIVDARVRRTVDLDGRPCAEVEVASGDDREATLLVYFAQAADPSSTVNRHFWAYRKSRIP